MADIIGDHLLIVGTYTSTLPHVVGKGQGILVLGYDSTTGEVHPGTVQGGLNNPTWVTVNHAGDRLYAIEEMPEDGAFLSCFSLDKETGQLSMLSRQSSLGAWPCHVSLDHAETRLFVSNYMSGSLVCFPLDGNGVPTAEGDKRQHAGHGPDPARQEGPHLHHALPTPDGQHVMACDAGLDTVFRYSLEGRTIAETQDLLIASDPGSFPRHLAFLPDGSGMLVLHEIIPQIDAYRFTSEGPIRVGRIAMLPQDWAGERSGAALRIHPSGRFAYASNRGHDSIVGIDLTSGLDQMRHIGWWSTEGAAPRDFNLDPAGQFLIAANQNTDTLTTFRVDSTTGALSLLKAGIAVHTPVCLAFVRR